MSLWGFFDRVVSDWLIDWWRWIRLRWRWIWIRWRWRWWKWRNGKVCSELLLLLFFFVFLFVDVDEEEKKLAASVFSHCSSLYSSPSMGDSSILLTAPTKQHCHRCNICRNKHRFFCQKWNKTGQKWTQWGKCGHSQTKNVQKLNKN